MNSADTQKSSGGDKERSEGPLKKDVRTERRPVNIFFGVLFVIYLGALPFLVIGGLFGAALTASASGAGWGTMAVVTIGPGLVIAGLWGLGAMLTKPW